MASNEQHTQNEEVYEIYERTYEEIAAENECDQRPMMKHTDERAAYRGHLWPANLYSIIIILPSSPI